jgi:serine phosphatase RsbU (regulator of sigma subunit)
VGGDYYDFFRLDDHRLGLLVADVAGKGTSAALYMAELKGLLLSLSRIHESPKPLLSEVNRVLADNLDSRSFITMTYAIVDLQHRTLTYARAGHTPLLHYRACDAGRPVVTSHAPEGLVLGLRIEGVAARFDQILQEATLPLAPGDAFVFYTDGITEAMNPASDLFGEERLLDLVAEFGHLPSDDLRDRILREVEAFVGDADQHDDMTMILLRVDPDGPSLVAAPGPALPTS